VETLPVLSLEQKKALVVGGAGGGIGSAITHSLSQAGAEIIVVTNDSDHAEVVRSEAKIKGCAIQCYLADVTDLNGFSETIDEIIKANGVIHHLVNVVGGANVSDWSRAKDYELEMFDRILTRNLRYALISCQRIAASLILNSSKGSIVNVSSIATRSVPLLTGYGAAKAGLEAMSRTMAAEWGQYGIRVNVVAPGTVKTPRAGQDNLDEAASKIPLQRRAESQDIADASLFLLSDKASYITGQTLTVDGGATLGSSGDSLPEFVTNPKIREQFS
jgi:NAD(P)-dependent dehydrogenase (short-subunit alcohol dehydrogenase family)|tara:strand:- start:46234 stop:47058 length:825 start_codon:yes stop_codon:yes gene_type:complete